MISYEPLWETMKEKKVSTYALIYKHGFSPHTLTKLRHNESITMNTLEKLCSVLGCSADSIVTFKAGEEEEKEEKEQQEKES